VCPKVYPIFSASLICQDSLKYPTIRVIPLAGRICAVAEVFDALTTDRPSRGTDSVRGRVALKEVDRGRRFDPLRSWTSFSDTATRSPARAGNSNEAAA